MPKKRVVALYAKVSDPNKPYDQIAFETRSKKSTSEILSFANGSEFVLNLVAFSKFGYIDDLRVHDHGFSGGIIGDGDNIGMYTQGFYEASGKTNSAATYMIAGEVRRENIKFSGNAAITIYGCNVAEFAKELSLYLRFHGRGDISVTGADNFVYEKNGMAYVDSRTTGLSQNRPGRFHTYKNGIEVGLPTRTRSYK